MRSLIRQILKAGHSGAALLAILSACPATATVWWPEVKPVSANLSVFRDYDDPFLFYYVPKTVHIAKNDDTGAIMINHGLFFNRLRPSDSTTQYNMTLEPLLVGKEIDQAAKELQTLYGANSRLVPLPITTVSFEVTSQLPAKADANNASGENQISAPFHVSVPNWTGDMHSFNQRFSVVMRGNPYVAEPAMSRFITNPAGNAFVGTMHYGFRGIQVPFKGHMKVNVHQFVQKIQSRMTAHFGFWAKIDIAAAIESLKDDQSVFVEVVRDAGYENEVWKSLVNKLIEVAFQPAPKAPDMPLGSTSGAVFGFAASYASSSVDRTVTIDLKEAIVKDHNGDVDVVGGGVAYEQLDKNIKYLCDMWAKFDNSKQSCADVCEPALEYWNPATKSCSPAFGGATN